MSSISDIPSWLRLAPTGLQQQHSLGPVSGTCSNSMSCSRGYASFCSLFAHQYMLQQLQT